MPLAPIMDGIVLKIVNIVLFATQLGGNVYSFTGEYGKQTYITPAAYAYYVWSLIHLLLLGFVIYQFFDSGKKLIIDKIAWRFALLAIFSSLYQGFAIRGSHIVAFIFSLLVSAVVTNIYVITRVGHSEKALGDELFAVLPFSLYHAWALVLVVLSGFEAFGREIHHHAGVGTHVFVFLALLFLEVTAVGYAFSSQEGDLAGAAVITWVLWAIFEHQKKDAFIHWSALAFAILSTFWVFKAFFFTWRASNGSPIALLHDEERAPLTGSS